MARRINKMVSVPPGLRARLDQFSGVNWSAVACRAFEAEIMAQKLAGESPNEIAMETGSFESNPFDRFVCLTDADYARLVALEDELRPIVALCSRGSRVKMFKDINQQKSGRAQVIVQIDDEEIATFLGQLIRRCGFCARITIADPVYKAKNMQTNCVVILLMPVPSNALP